MSLSNTVIVQLSHCAQGPPFFNGGLKTKHGILSFLAGLLICIQSQQCLQSVSGFFSSAGQLLTKQQNRLLDDIGEANEYLLAWRRAEIF